ncbi:MAG TPA: tripartite tricarboxylate transporter substrate binding protein [Rectinemataceae bacterium]|nr:tripartite tricarboxylate transporter substrate binding protein [Rectinemataceae bacterium]
MKKSVSVLVALVLAFGFVALASAAPAYPSKPLEIVAPANPGGGFDALARAVDRALNVEKLYPQPTAVVNKPGAGGAVGFSYMQMKAKDSYELTVFSPPLIIGNVNGTFPGKYTELTPLAKLITDYQIFLVRADSPYKTFKDLMDAVKKDPAAVKFAGGSAAGNMDHLAFCKVAKAYGVDPSKLVYVAFAGGGEAIITLLGGNVAFVSTGVGEALGQIQAGTVRALAVTSPERRSGVLASVPTVKEAGIDVTYEVWRGLFGTQGMSQEAKDWWAKSLKTMSQTATWKDSCDKLQWVNAYADSAAFAKFLTEEYNSYSALMKDLGLAK